MHVLSDEDLEKMVYYVEKSHIRRFTIRASAVFTRDFDVEANSYEDAVEKVKAIILGEKCRVSRIEDFDLNTEEQLLHELLTEKDD